jgi:aminopeptidase N
MALHQLRLAVGDDAFFTILRDWAASRSGKTGSTGQFQRLAERVSGQQLDELFQTWLFLPEKPVLEGVAAQSQRKAATSKPPAAAASELARYFRGRR